MVYSADDIVRIRRELGLTQQQFADRLGVTRELLNKIEGKKRAISKATQILLGKLESEIKSEQSTKTHEIEEVKELPKLSFIEERRRKMLNDTKEVWFPVYAGNTQLRERYDIVVYADSEKEAMVPIGYLPQTLFPGCDHAEKCFGNSMYPRIANQGLAVGKVIDKHKIVYGELYGIHYDGNPPIAKYVAKSDVVGCIRVVSDNKAIADQDIPYDDISFMFRILHIVNPA